MTTRVPVLMLVLAACGAPSAEPLSSPERAVRRAAPDPEPASCVDRTSLALPPVSGPRPDVDISHLVPDPTHELRWPLSASQHPVLDPQFEIARAFAEPGVGWMDLCRRGAQNRNAGKDKRDHVAYLRGWCSVGKHDTDAALSQLAPLMRSIVPGLGGAVRADLSNILVVHGGADDARRLLAKHRISDIAVLDTLAATYVELGKVDDAYDINELALAQDKRADLGARCQRLTRRIVLRPPAQVLRDSDFVPTSLFDVSGNETCTRLENELTCWLTPGADCARHLGNVKVEIVKGLWLLKSYHEWPTGRMHNWEWWNLYVESVTAMPLQGADRLAAAALMNSLRSSLCDSQQRINITDAARKLHAAPGHDPTIDASLTAIITDPRPYCLEPTGGEPLCD